MSRRITRLDQIEISKPCPVDWSRMVGDEKSRHCAQCNKRVFNLTKMTRRQAEVIVEASGGRLCARITRQPDGTIVTEDYLLQDYSREDHSRSLHLISRRASPIATAVITAVMTISGAGIAQSPLPTSDPVAVASLATGGGQPRVSGATGTVFGILTDPTGAVIAEAKLTLTNEATGESTEATTNDDGAYKFILLAPGSYTLTAVASGFAPVVLERLPVVSSQEQNLTLQAQAAVAVMAGAIAVRQQPLRVLYNESDLIAVASVGKTTRVQAKESSILFKTALHISSAIKGDTREPVVNVYHWAYGGQQDTYANGDRLLVFLKRRVKTDDDKSAGGYEVEDETYGVKKLSDADLSIYLQRMQALEMILAEEKPEIEGLLEWLVRCVEEPATRWEGASDLFSSYTSEFRGAKTEAASERPGEDGTGQENPTFVSLLSAEQKKRLEDVLFNIDELTERDQQLVRVVRSWNDDRVVPFLLSQLRRWQANPPDIALGVMFLVTEFVYDEQLQNLSAEYYSTATGEQEEKAEDATAGDNRSQKTDSTARNRSAVLQQFILAVEAKTGH